MIPLLALRAWMEQGDTDKLKTCRHGGQGTEATGEWLRQIGLAPKILNR